MEEKALQFADVVGVRGDQMVSDRLGLARLQRLASVSSLVSAWIIATGGSDVDRCT
jgi:hypothetical protein